MEDDFGLPLPLPSRPEKTVSSRKPAGFLQRLFKGEPTEEEKFGLYYNRAGPSTDEYPELNDFRPDPLTEAAFADEIRDIRKKNFMGTAGPENLKKLESLEKELKVKPTIRYEYIRKLFNEFLDDYKNVILGGFVSEERLKELDYIRHVVYPSLRERLGGLPEVKSWPYLYGVDPMPEANAAEGVSMRGSPVPVEGVEDPETAGLPQPPRESNVVLINGRGGRRRRGGRRTHRKGKGCRRPRRRTSRKA